MSNITKYKPSNSSKTMGDHIIINYPLTEDKIDKLILERTGESPVQTFVMPSDIEKISAYKKFENSESQIHFRFSLLDSLEAKWNKLYGKSKGEEFKSKFRKIVSQLDENGAIVFGALLDQSNFGKFLDKYTTLINAGGSKSWLHSFVNLGKFPEFINSSEYNGAFLHPLLIALIAYQMGGMVHLIDCRAKDVKPSSFLGSDSRLHIDGTPFEERYHILLSWEKDKISGPKGQNFTFIPGTHKGVRNCFVNPRNEAWATENGNIFITKGRIEQIFDIQKTVLKTDKPIVIEACYPLKPLTIVFDAASLAHHRYRNTEGSARSSIALAFRRTHNQEKISSIFPFKSSETTRLNHFLFEDCTGDTDLDFIDALSEHSFEIAVLINRIDSNEDCAEVIEHSKLNELSTSNLEKWKEIMTESPDIEQTKKDDGYLPLNASVTREAFFNYVIKMMMLDKHGTLDLIFYTDNREIIRQASRIKIREMKEEQIVIGLKPWFGGIQQPTCNDLLSPKQLQDMAFSLVESADIWINNNSSSEKNELVQQCHSLKQFLTDLGEAITRCDQRQTFLSTSLFLFWSCDALFKLYDSGKHEHLAKMGQELLASYIATAILNEKQINKP